MWLRRSSRARCRRWSTPSSTRSRANSGRRSSRSGGEANRKRPGEFALIDRYFRPLAGDRGAFGLTDDAALYRQRPGDDLVLTADMVAAGVHFLPEDAPESIARKALRVNLSDLAAKGAEPFGYLLSLALPANWTEAWVKRFAAGLAADQKRYGVTLARRRHDARRRRSHDRHHRDRPRSRRARWCCVQAPDPATRSSCPAPSATARSAFASARDELAKARGAKHLLDRYLHPQPRVALAPVLRRHATSAIDVSDGLVGDLAHICETSGVGAEIGADLVPLSPAARAVLASDRTSLSADPQRRRRLRDPGDRAGVRRCRVRSGG